MSVPIRRGCCRECPFRRKAESAELLAEFFDGAPAALPFLCHVEGSEFAPGPRVRCAGFQRRAEAAGYVNGEGEKP